MFRLISLVLITLVTVACNGEEGGADTGEPAR